MLQTEIDKQRVLQDFVNREVIYCVSSLVYSMQDNYNAIQDFPELFEGPPNMGDYTCPGCKHEWSEEPPAKNTASIECPAWE